MKHLFSLLTIVSVLFAACEPVNDIPQETPQDESNFLVTTKTVNVAAEGGECVIEYTIAQPTEGLEIEASTDVEWISDIAVAETVTFAVAANEAEEQRTATITLRYGAEEYSVAVKQAGTKVNEEPEPAPEGYPADSAPENYNFKYRMLLIDHTGTNCGYCPYMMEALKEVEESPNKDYFNIAMAHSYNSSDKAYSNAAVYISGYYQATVRVLTGYPCLTYNYQYNKSSNQDVGDITRKLYTLKKESTDAAVAVSAKLDGDKMVVYAALKSKETRNYKINILLLEDNIYSTQYNAFEDWMNTHNNAIRESYYKLTGYSDISGVEWGDVEAMTTEYKTFEMAIDSKYVKENCKVLVVIAAPDANYGNKYEVVNTVMCKPGESKPFEYR